MRQRVLEMAVAVSIAAHVVVGVVLERMDRDEDDPEESEREREVVEMEIVEPVAPVEEQTQPLTIVTLVETPEAVVDPEAVVETPETVVDSEAIVDPGAVVDPRAVADPVSRAVVDRDDVTDQGKGKGKSGLSMRTGVARGIEVPPGEGGGGFPTAAVVARALVPDPGPPPEFDPFNAMPWYTPPEPTSELRPTGGGTHETDEGVFTARVTRDGTVEFDDAPNLQIHGTSGSFDLTDWAMRRNGDDPYSSRKLAFLDRTRDERAEIALTNRAEDLKDAVGHLSTYLGKIWAYTEWTAAEKRVVLFQLWDECAEDGPADIVEAAERARGTIVSFIRRELPAGSADAYTTDELRELNRARTSEQMFLPYEERGR